MRKTYIDNIRWITVFLVFVFHVIYIFNGIITDGVIGPFYDVQYQDAFQYVVYPWFMVLLFVISGMSARFYLNSHSEREFIRTRTVKLLVPSTLGLLVFWWILGYYNMLISGAFEKMGNVPKPVLFLIMAVSGTGVLWFTQVLWVLSVLLVLIRRIEKDRLYVLGKKANILFLIALMPVIWGCANILNTPVIVVYRFGIYGASFLIGYFIFSHDEVMDRLMKYAIPLTIVAVLSMCAFVRFFWKKPFAEHEVLDTFFCNFYAWAAVLAILSFMRRWGNFSTPFSRWMARKSWGLYLFHYLTLAIPAWYLTQYCPQLPPPAVYLICAAMSFTGAIALYEIISRIPVLRWFACGISKKHN